MKWIRRLILKIQYKYVMWKIRRHNDKFIY